MFRFAFDIMLSVSSAKMLMEVKALCTWPSINNFELKITTERTVIHFRRLLLKPQWSLLLQKVTIHLSYLHRPSRNSSQKAACFLLYFVLPRCSRNLIIGSFTSVSGWLGVLLSLLRKGKLACNSEPRLT